MSSFSKNKVSDSMKSAKQKAFEAENEAKRIADEGVNKSFGAIPSTIGKVQEVANQLIDQVNVLVDENIKNETGYTLTELKYKCADGIKLFNEYKELSKSKHKGKSEDKDNEISEKRQQRKEELIAWLESQSDEVFNAFYLLQMKETAENLQTGVSALWNGGMPCIKETLEEINSMDKIFG